jgi:hypothetical protein
MIYRRLQQYSLIGTILLFGYYMDQLGFFLTWFKDPVVYLMFIPFALLSVVVVRSIRLYVRPIYRGWERVAVPITAVSLVVALVCCMIDIGYALPRTVDDWAVPFHRIMILTVSLGALLTTELVGFALLRSPRATQGITIIGGETHG